MTAMQPPRPVLGARTTPIRARRVPCLLLVLLAVGLFGVASPAALAQTQGLAPAEKALMKLAPDLRDLVKTGASEPVLVSVLTEGGAPVEGFMLKAARSKPLGAFRWVTGEISPRSLPALAATTGVLSVTSASTFKPAPAPGLDELRVKREALTGEKARELLKSGGKEALRETLSAQREKVPAVPERPRVPKAAAPDAALTASTPRLPPPPPVTIRDIHGATQAEAKGYTGAGVVAAVVDTGVDFAHPDLQGAQARVAGGAYAGWPFAYNTISGVNYALDPDAYTVGPDTYWNLNGSGIWYAHTLPVEGAACNGATCTGSLLVDYGNLVPGWNWLPVTLEFTWPDTSKSGQYHYTVHPDWQLLVAAYNLGLGYASTYAVAPVVIVSDEVVKGVYDTVYVDINYDRNMTNDKPQRKGDELAGADLFDAFGNPGADGLWDLSGGMLTWISNGTNPPPGVSAIYENVTVPGPGRLISFVGDGDGHGTSCASDIAGRRVISDPAWIGPTNPLFAGAAEVGGIGGPVIQGMARNASIAAMQYGFNFPLDAWTVSALGFDGVRATGDEAQICSNSWGNSGIINDGWDPTSRFAQELSRYFAPTMTFLVSTGNGGHGFGTVTTPSGPTGISVGASTYYGSTMNFEFVTPAQLTYGAIQPWSNRGPGMLGDPAPNICAVGAWDNAAMPLNLALYSSRTTGTLFANGQSAYEAFGGTSMSCPVAAGNVALVYEAFRKLNGRWPTWEETRGLVLTTARDLGYNALTQGAGDIDSNAATDAAGGGPLGWRMTPEQWRAGDYKGAQYPAFPAVMAPGGTAQKTFSVTNLGSSTVALNLLDRSLQQVFQTTVTVNMPAGPPSAWLSPAWLYDITSLVTTHNPDLVRAQVIFPYEQFDSDGDYTYDSRWRALFYDWSDTSADGKFWTDNGNGFVDQGELQLSELNRFTYGYPGGTYLEANLGRDALSRRHNGVLFGLQRRTGWTATTLKVRFTFYRKIDWSWLTLDKASISVGPGATGTFTATLAIPQGTAPGVYEGLIEIGPAGSPRRVVPVTANVVADGLNFSFGSGTLTETQATTPYDNGHLFGGFNWDWRYEAGDWKVFFFDAPATKAGSQFLVVDTRWKSPKTDVDTFIYGAATDAFSTNAPTFYGPSGVEFSGGSVNSNIGGGTFRWQTSSGGPREVVSAVVKPGLGFIALHNVLHGGADFGEQFTGRVYTMDVSPCPVNVTTTDRAGSFMETLTPTSAIDDGIVVSACGLFEPVNLTGQTAHQDNPNDRCTASWVTSTDIANGASLEVRTTSTQPMDIDVFVYRDNGDNVWSCTDTLVASATSNSPNETVIIPTPADGKYWITVHGYSVPGGTGAFDITIDAMQGRDLSVSSVPTGPLAAGVPVNFKVNWNTAAGPAPKVLKGRITIGTPSAPSMIQVPVTLNLNGTAGVATDPAGWDFGKVNSGGGTANKQFTITNHGTNSVTLGTLFFTGPDRSQFSLTSNTCNGAALAPTGWCTAMVNFAPTTTGDKYAVLGVPTGPASAIYSALSGEGAGTAPTANFSASPLSGPRPLQVQFTDASTGNPTGWSWTFGDGGTSPLQNPAHIYQGSGAYSVTLTVQNSGGSHSVTKSSYVSAGNSPTPTADFMGFPTSGKAPLMVAFANLSTGNITSYAWNFGDGATSTAWAPVHTYTAPGTYTVSLQMTGDGGVTDTRTLTNYITVGSVAPSITAEFAASVRRGRSPLGVLFTDRTYGLPTSWLWNFGDSATSTLQSPYHVYDKPGVYTVSLTVSGPAGSDAEVKTAYVAVGGPGYLVPSAMYPLLLDE